MADQSRRYKRIVLAAHTLANVMNYESTALIYYLLIVPGVKFMLVKKIIAAKLNWTW